MIMDILAYFILVPLFLNAFVAFFVAFYWQAKVIFSVYRVSDWTNANVPWKALGDPASPQNTFGRFWAGEIFPELRRSWLKAIGYVAASYAALFLATGIVELIAPEVIG